MKKVISSICALALAAGAGLTSPVQAADPIRFALIRSATGPNEIYARDTERGFRLGLEYLTGGKNEILGRPVEVIVKDDQFKPELSKAMVTEAFADDKADVAVGTSWSGGALAMAPVAEQYRKILLMEPALADSITGDHFNRYIFRASRNSTQDALASAAMLKPGDSVAFLAADYVFGKDGVAAYKTAMETMNSGASVVHEEFVPVNTTDFTAPMQRIYSKLRDAPGNRYLVLIWGAPNPIPKLAATRPDRYGIQIVSVGSSNIESIQAWRGLPVGGGTFYFWSFPDNPMNDWLVEQHNARYGQPPDLFTVGGFTAAAALVAGIEKAGTVETEALIAAMEGMSFDTPKGRITFRAEDHQGMQDQYQFRMKEKPESRWDLLDLVRVVPADEMPVPVRAPGRVQN
ncbi:ABC transporter permease [Haematobacter massiliensis]|uniref:ABC transporter permease n=1 Tax=Haematobacter massiliensis TaxID=195105 RepID=A0A086Y295_9RHOB|nr:substrate-binding domain-containing protein [Haematobacter massiliensis]KFI28395.1 ABC transporter permease [Haematobacter massiliensis]OWJ84665.1 ABC transporter permease [Haematobacter massiliensis]QBJ26370.1 ABC transporter permease [Haematobacter massiliensis]